MSQGRSSEEWRREAELSQRRADERRAQSRGREPLTFLAVFGVVACVALFVLGVLLVLYALGVFRA